MKLGVYLETTFLLSKDMVYCSDVYTLLLNSIANEYDITYLGRNSQDFAKINKMYLVDSKISYIPIENYTNLVSLLIKYPIYRKKNYNSMRKFIQSVETVLIMAPSPISLDLINLALEYKKKVIILIRQDTRKMISFRYKGIQKVVAMYTADRLEKRLEYLIRKNELPVLALGPELFNHFKLFTPYAYAFASSRFRENNIISSQQLNIIDFTKPVNILFVGRVEINKGITELLLALSEIKDFNFNLTIVGDGLYMDYIKIKAEQLNLHQKITYLGYMPFGNELLDIYRSNDIFVLPSYSEGLPQVILEAMASGCLVISTKVGSVPFVINDGNNGFLCEPKDSLSIKNVLNNLLKLDALQILKIRKQGIETAKSYAYEKQITVLKNLL